MCHVPVIVNEIKEDYMTIFAFQFGDFCVPDTKREMILYYTTFTSCDVDVRGFT